MIEHSVADPRGYLDPPGRPTLPPYDQLREAFAAAVQAGDGTDVLAYGKWLSAFEDYAAAAELWQAAADRQHEQLRRSYGELKSEARILAELAPKVGGDIYAGGTVKDGSVYSLADHEARIAEWRKDAAAYDPGCDWSAVEPSEQAVPIPPRQPLACLIDRAHKPPPYSIARDRVLDAMARAGARAAR
jgi:hypothetical protein